MTSQHNTILHITNLMIFFNSGWEVPLTWITMGRGKIYTTTTQTFFFFDFLVFGFSGEPHPREKTCDEHNIYVANAKFALLCMHVCQKMRPATNTTTFATIITTTTTIAIIRLIVIMIIIIFSITINSTWPHSQSCIIAISIIISIKIDTMIMTALRFPFNKSDLHSLQRSRL